MRSTAIFALRPRRAPILARQPWPLIRNNHFTNRRLQSQLLYRPDGSTYRKQSVIFKKPPILNFRRVATITVYSLTVYYGAKYAIRFLGIDIAIEEVDEIEEQRPDKKLGQVAEEEELAEDDMLADEDSLFIPMTWATKLPRTYYKGSDPEWQEFIKIAKDDELRQKIAGELIEAVRVGAQTKGIMRHLGQLKPESKHWLDIVFPDGPPQEFVRSGLEFGEDYIAWSQQKITDEMQERISRALWPSITAYSALESLAMQVRLTIHQLAQVIGYKTSGEFEQERAAIARMKKVHEAAHSGLNNKTQTDPSDASGGASGDPARGRQASDASSSLGQWLPRPSVRLPSTTDANDKMPNVQAFLLTMAFWRTFSKSWKKHDLDPPRGTFIMHGMVELKGVNGRMMFDVAGIYDPKQSKFVKIHAVARNFKRWKQIPKGGN